MEGGGGWEWGGAGFKLLQLQAKKRFLEMKYNRKSNAKERWISEITNIFLTPDSKIRYDSNEANYICFCDNIFEAYSISITLVTILPRFTSYLLSPGGEMVGSGDAGVSSENRMLT